MIEDEPDSYSHHEAMHVASMFADMVGDRLVDHRAIKCDPKRIELADAAFQALFNLYQLIGREHLEQTNDKQQD